LGGVDSAAGGFQGITFLQRHHLLLSVVGQAIDGVVHGIAREAVQRLLALLLQILANQNKVVVVLGVGKGSFMIQPFH
jgi:uridylate kinase